MYIHEHTVKGVKCELNQQNANERRRFIAPETYKLWLALTTWALFVCVSLCPLCTAQPAVSFFHPLAVSFSYPLAVSFAFCVYGPALMAVCPPNGWLWRTVREHF